MKKIFFGLGFLSLFLLAYGCRKNSETPEVILKEGEGLLVIRTSVRNDAVFTTKGSDTDLPLPAKMTLEIYPDGKDEASYTIEDLEDTKELGLRAGDYKLVAYSEIMRKPAFERPVYTGEKSVLITAGSTTRTDMNCTLANAGIRFQFSDDFMAGYQSCWAKVVQNGNTLFYENDDLFKIGFFPPGMADIYVIADGITMEIPGQMLEARSIYTVSITQDHAPDGSFDLGLHIENGYDNKELGIQFKYKGRVYLFQETVGAEPVSIAQNADQYNGYLCQHINYTGSHDVEVLYNGSYSSSGYNNPSGGNHWRFQTANSNLSIKGIDITGASNLVLGFGVYHPTDKTFSSDDLEIYYAVDGAAETKLEYHVAPTTLNQDWLWVEIKFPKLPENLSNVALSLVSTKPGLVVDDIILTGIKIIHS